MIDLHAARQRTQTRETSLRLAEETTSTRRTIPDEGPEDGSLDERAKRLRVEIEF